MNLFPVFWILILMWQQTVLIAHKNSEKYLKHKLVFHMMSYSQEPSQTSDTTKPEKETNFWHEISEKKDTFFSQLKTKFSNQERRGQKAASYIFNSYDFLRLFPGLYSCSACLFECNKSEQSETKSSSKSLLEEIFMPRDPCWVFPHQRRNVSELLFTKLFFIFKCQSDAQVQLKH